MIPPRRFALRVLPPHVLLLLAAGALGGGTAARVPGISEPGTCQDVDRAPMEAAALTPLEADPYSDVDPLEAFHAWRMANRVTLPVTPQVWEAHLQWQELHPVGPSAKRGGGKGRPVPESLSASNVCPASGVSTYQGEVNVAANPNNSSQLVAGANSFYQDPAAGCQAPSGTTYGTQALYGSSDGGTTWTYNCAPWPSGDTGSVGTIMYGSDPAMAWDASNNAYAAYMLISQNSFGTRVSSSIVVAKSMNSGATWSPLSIVVNNLSNARVFDDKDMMAIDTTSGQTHSHANRMYVIWDENNVERVAYADAPSYATWTTVVVDSSGGDIGGDVAVGPDGTVYAVWDRYSTTGGVGKGDKLMFASSANGGASWTSPVQLAQHNLASFGTNNAPPAQDKRKVNAFPSIDVDRCATSPRVGALYVTYCDFPAAVGSGTDLNTYVIASTNGGSTWSSQVKVNDDAGTATQFFPWLSVDPATGYVNVSWYDTRNDTNNRKTQIFFAQSTDGGASFSANFQVTAASNQFVNSGVAYSDENSADNTLYNANQYGDYAGIASLGGYIHPLWTDSRQFYPTSGSALVEDAATATLACLPPTGVAASNTPSGVTVSWTAAPGAGSYNIVRTTGACPSSTSPVTFTGVTSPYTDTSGAEGQSYCYVVQAVNPCGTYAASGVTGTHLTPPGVPNGSGGSTPVKGAKLASDGSSIAVTWDTTCAAQQYEIVYGGGSQLPTSYAGTYGVTAGACAIGTTGSYTWGNGIVPSTDPTGFYWWLVVATDGSSTEGSWGQNSGPNERTGPGAGGSSGLCGVSAKSLANTCGQ